MNDIPLRDFRSTSANLARHEQSSIVREALRVLQGLYAHGFGDSVDYTSALNRLRGLESLVARGIPERTFHDEMIGAFKLLRDAHTHYLLPQVFHRRIAYLPVVIGDYFENGKRKYCASSVDAEKIPDTQLVTGVEITHWNGTPIEAAIDCMAHDENGAHPAARHARALAALTMRPTWLLPLPDRDSATLTYASSTGTRDANLTWNVTGLQESEDDSHLGSAVDTQSKAIQQLRTLLFSERLKKSDDSVGEALRASDIGYIRLANFFFGDEPFVTNFASFLASQPAGGLIVDIRGNPGGYLPAGERALQLLGDGGPIKPTTWELRATPEALLLCRAISEAAHIPPAEKQQFAEYIPSLEEALKYGRPTTASFQATTSQDANNIGQVYRGPVVLLTDALTYSVGDVFAAGFQDHRLGTILGVDEATGAGGSNDVAYETVAKLLPATFPSLPHGASFRISLRRCRRAGSHNGALIEKLGVSSDRVHRLTRQDRLADFSDLLDQARAIVRQQ